MIGSVGILGCGWLGRALATELVRAGVRVVGSTTRVENVKAIESIGADGFVLSFVPDRTGAFDPFLDVDALVVSVPPSRGVDPLAQAGAIASAIAESVATHVILISTTSVYPKNGERVSETDASQDHSLSRVEEKYRALSKCVTILRCAGLFGPERLILPALLRMDRVVDEGAPVNLVERSDVVGAVLAARREPERGVFNVCADEHPTKGTFYRSLAQRSGLPAPTFETKSEPYHIVDNGRFKERYGFEYAYPDPVSFPVE